MTLPWWICISLVLVATIVCGRYRSRFYRLGRLVDLEESSAGLLLKPGLRVSHEMSPASLDYAVRARLNDDEGWGKTPLEALANLTDTKRAREIGEQQRRDLLRAV